MVIMSGASERLAQALAERGYVLVTTPLDAFLKSGGSACCLTLRLDHGLQAAREAAAQRIGRRARRGKLASILEDRVEGPMSHQPGGH